MADDSALRIQIAIRSGMIAKAALEMLGMEPRIIPLQINEIAGQLAELRELVRKDAE